MFILFNFRLDLIDENYSEGDDTEEYNEEDETDETGSLETCSENVVASASAEAIGKISDAVTSVTNHVSAEVAYFLTL